MFCICFAFESLTGERNQIDLGVKIHISNRLTSILKKGCIVLSWCYDMSNNGCNNGYTHCSNVCFLFLGPGSHLMPTHWPWPLPHPWAQNPVVTNPPEIIAETAKLTPTVSGATSNSKLTISNPHQSYHHQNHHVDGRTQTRDHFFLSRLRNRYRQVWWDLVLFVCSTWRIYCVSKYWWNALKTHTNK